MAALFSFLALSHGLWNIFSRSYVIIAYNNKQPSEFTMFRGQPVSVLWNANISDFLEELNLYFRLGQELDEREVGGLPDLVNYIYFLFTVEDKVAWNDQWTYPGAEYCSRLQERFVCSAKLDRAFFSLEQRQLIKLFYAFKEIECYILTQVAKARLHRGGRVTRDRVSSNARTVVVGCAAVNYLMPLMQRYFFKIYWLFSNSLRLRRVELGMLPEVPFADNFPTVDAVPTILRDTVLTPIWQGQRDLLKQLIADLGDGSGVILKPAQQGCPEMPIKEFLLSHTVDNFRSLLLTPEQLRHPETALLHQHIILVQLMRYFNLYSWLASDPFAHEGQPVEKINLTNIIVGRLLNIYFASLFASFFIRPNNHYYTSFGLAYTFSNEYSANDRSPGSSNRDSAAED